MTIASLETKLSSLPKKVARFRVLLLMIIIGLLYLFLLWRFVVLSTAQPDESQISSQSRVTQPHIDPALISKINQLQDNSVTVQALFNQARQNPFQE